MVTIKAWINSMKNFQPDEFQFHMCSCTYEIQPDEFSPRGWKSQFQLIEKFHQNFTKKISSGWKNSTRWNSFGWHYENFSYELQKYVLSFFSN